MKHRKTIKIDGFLSFTPPLNADVLFCSFFLNLTLCMTKLRGPVLSFPDFTDISLVFGDFQWIWRGFTFEPAFLLLAKFLPN
jgi:hypothetical protein